MHSSLVLFDVWPDSSLTCQWCLSLQPRRRRRCALCVPPTGGFSNCFFDLEGLFVAALPGVSEQTAVMNNYCGNVFFFSSHTRRTYCASRACTYQSSQTSNSPIHRPKMARLASFDRGSAATLPAEVEQMERKDVSSRIEVWCGQEAGQTCTRLSGNAL